MAKNWKNDTKFSGNEAKELLMRNSYFIFIFIFCENYTGWPQETLAVIFDRLGTTTVVL